MKVGDLVRLCPDTQWLNAEACSAVGVIIDILDRGSHRKNTSYSVLWSNPIPPTIQDIGWHTKQSLRHIK